MGSTSSVNYSQKQHRKPSKPLLSFVVVLLATLGCNNVKPGASIGAAPFTFVAVGDMGCACSDQRQVANQMIAWRKEHPFDTIIVPGDVIYPESSEVRGGNKKLFWSHFDQFYQPLIDRGARFYVALGNHDMETESGAHEIADKQRFNILSPEGYYSFSSTQQEDGAPLITFYALNSNTLIRTEVDSAQLEWLSNALANDRSVWKVAYFHHPIYTADGPHRGESLLQDRLEPLLKSGNVRVVVNGHNHFYSRMKPVDGIYHFTSGGGGRNLYPPRINSLTAIAVRAHHFMYFQVFEKEIRFYAITASGARIDEGRIVRTVP
jgi:hypothetical protein